MWKVQVLTSIRWEDYPNMTFNTKEEALAFGQKLDTTMVWRVREV